MPQNVISEDDGMKRRVFLIILAAVLCMAAAASALELTFSQTCKHKLSRATQLYVDPEGNGELVPSSMLAAGTYVIPNGQSVNGMTGISYSTNERNVYHGYIDGSAITSATQTVTLPSGRKVVVGEALVRSRTALNLWLEMEYGESLDSGTYTDADGNEHEIGNEDALGDESSINGDAAWAQAVANGYVANGASVRTVYQDDEGNETEVEVTYMGLIRSMVVLNGEEQLVETWRLSWETKAPEGKVLAIVRSDISNAMVRVKPSGTSMKRVSGGRVVQVVNIGRHYTLVDINDSETPLGYIATDSLEFYPNIHTNYQTAKVSINGKTNARNDPVVIYTEDRTGAGACGERIQIGSPLTVYAQNDKWSEVDAIGYHGFILNKYVTLDSEETDAGE